MRLGPAAVQTDKSATPEGWKSRVEGNNFALPYPSSTAEAAQRRKIDAIRQRVGARINDFKDSIAPCHGQPFAPIMDS